MANGRANWYHSGQWHWQLIPRVKSSGSIIPLQKWLNKRPGMPCLTSTFKPTAHHSLWSSKQIVKSRSGPLPRTPPHSKFNLLFNWSSALGPWPWPLTLSSFFYPVSDLWTCGEFWLRLSALVPLTPTHFRRNTPSKLKSLGHCGRGEEEGICRGQQSFVCSKFSCAIGGCNGPFPALITEECQYMDIFFQSDY